jgi:type IX secretion system PorP/SprF family membrane protein
MLIAMNGRAQDPVFSQFYASSLYLNPAMAGIEPNWAFSLNHRNQWKKITGNPYVTTQASFTVPFYRKDVNQRHWGGTGVSVFNDNAGVGSLRSTGANVSLAYNLPVSSLHTVLFALQMGFINKSVSTDFQWGGQFDPNSPGGVNNGAGIGQVSGLMGNTLFLDAGAGFLYYYNAGRDYEQKGISAYLGGSANHLNKPNQTLLEGQKEILPFLFKGHGGFEVNISSSLNFSPNFIYASQDLNSQLNVGAYFTVLLNKNESVLAPQNFIFGGWYRIDDAVIGSLGFSNNFYTLGFSYDANSQNLGGISNGRSAYEISLKITKLRPGKTVRFYTPRI